MPGRKRLIAAGILVTVVASGATGYRSDLPYGQVKADYEVPASAYVEVGDATLHYTDRGKGETLVLIHGSGAEQGAYDALGAALIEQNFRVIAFDLPGSGLSLAGPATGFRNEDNVVLVQAFIDALDLDLKAIIGHSTGGQIAWSLGLDAPEVSDRLILLAPTGLPTPSPLTWTIARIPVIGAMLKNITPEFVVRQNLKEAVFDNSQVTDAQVRRYHDLLLRDGGRDALFARMNATTFERAAELGCLTLPTLVVWGDEDVWLPVDLGEKFAKAIPNADLITLADTGHNLPAEVDPVALARRLTEWLRAPRRSIESLVPSDVSADSTCSD